MTFQLKQQHGKEKRMAWSWSHTEEAYENARHNLEQLPQEELAVIAAEWDGYFPEDDGSDGEGFVLSSYDEALPRRQQQTADELAEYAWDRACDERTCDNGGWNAWVCPYGCHTVPFSRPAGECGCDKPSYEAAFELGYEGRQDSDDPDLVRCVNCGGYVEVADDERELVPLRVVTLTQEQIRACPHYIIDPSHYRPDGSCRCDDPGHTTMRPWGYRWREDLGRWT